MRVRRREREESPSEEMRRRGGRGHESLSWMEGRANRKEKEPGNNHRG